MLFQDVRSLFFNRVVRGAAQLQDKLLLFFNLVMVGGGGLKLTGPCRAPTSDLGVNEHHALTTEPTGRLVKGFYSYVKV